MSSPSPGTGTIRTCPACQGANASSRELCGRCGVDLDTGRPLPTPVRTRSFARTTAPPTRRRWWLPPLAVLVVVAGIVAGLAFTGTGPFDREPDVPGASFDASRYSRESQPLPLSSVATLTTREGTAERSFTPEQMVDEDETTAWHSDVQRLPDGTGEVVDLFLAEAAWVTQIVVRNGDHHDPAAYEATARIRKARLVMDGGTSMTLNLLDLGRQTQLIALPEPALTTSVRLEVLSAVPGGAQDVDVALSGIALHGFEADDADRRLAERRADIRPASGPIAAQS